MRLTNSNFNKKKLNHPQINLFKFKKIVIAFNAQIEF
jgi:hypothetical protein